VSNREHAHLVHVAELRVSVSEVLDLSSGFANQTVVSLAQVALLVLPLAIKDSESGEKAHADLTSQVDSMTCRIPWCILTGIRPAIC
jgi:hypothetical protein